MLCIMQLTQCTLLLQGMLCLHLLSFLQPISVIDYETVLALCFSTFDGNLKSGKHLASNATLPVLPVVHHASDVALYRLL